MWGRTPARAVAGLALAPWQWGALAAAYAVFFVAPALWMARRAKRDGDKVAIWTALVLVGSVMGIVEYFEHRAILQARARRGDEPPDYGAAAPRQGKGQEAPRQAPPREEEGEEREGR